MKPEPTTEELLATMNQPLPFSDDAEKGVLSCLLHYPAKIEDCPPLESFYHDAHRTIASHIVAVWMAGKPVDMVSLTHSLKAAGKFDLVGGANMLAELCAFLPIAAHFTFYCGLLADKYSQRRMISALASGLHRLLNSTGERSVADDLQHCQQLVCEAANDDGSADLQYTAIKDLVAQVLDDAQTMAESGSRLSGLSTGIDAIDAITGGLEAGGLTVVAAESSDGKSSLCRQMLEAVAIAGHVAVDYTYEMMPKTEARRVLCSQGRIDAKNLKMGMLTRGEQLALAAQVRKVSAWDMHIVDVAGKTIEQICRDIVRRRRKLPKGQKLVALIDYIQLCKTSASTTSREREVAHITATAKQCAKMTGAHILMPSQQNKNGDVRESMAIEQDSDTLIQIQKITEKKDSKPAWQRDLDGDDDQPNNTRKIFFKKVRDGERYTHTIMNLVGRFYRFDAVQEEATA